MRDWERLVDLEVLGCVWAAVAVLIACVVALLLVTIWLNR
jgi:hypothetical protein